MGHIERTDRPKPWRARYRTPDGRKTADRRTRRLVLAWIRKLGDVPAGSGSMHYRARVLVNRGWLEELVAPLTDP
jgi:hypothetical protein